MVLDEAHNIENISRSAASAEFSQSQLELAITELDYAHYNKSLPPEVHSAMKHLSELLQGLKSWLSRQDDLLTQEAFETFSFSWLGFDAVKQFDTFGLSHVTMEFHNVSQCA